MSVNSHGNSNNNSNGRTNDQPVSPGESDSDKDKVHTHNIVHYYGFLTIMLNHIRLIHPQIQRNRKLVALNWNLRSPCYLIRTTAELPPVCWTWSRTSSSFLAITHTSSTGCVCACLWSSQIQLTRSGYSLCSLGNVSHESLWMWSGRGPHVIRGMRYVQVSIL